MPDRLRYRLFLSHILPLLILIPLAGIALVYMLETRVVLVNLSQQLRGQAVLVAELARAYPDVWRSTEQAEAFLLQVNPLFRAETTLLAADGTVLATSDPSDAGLTGQTLEEPHLRAVLSGEESTALHYGLNLQEELIVVMVPARDAEGQVVGVVRLNDRYGQVYERLLPLRTLTLTVLGIALGVGAGLAGLLALSLERPLAQLTDAVAELSQGGRWESLPVQGPQEVRLLTETVNSLSARLRSFEETRRRLLANLVHELGNPLATLNSATYTLLHWAAEEDPALRRELLIGIQGELQRLRRLVDDLAELREHIVGPLELTRQPTPLSDWLPPLLRPWCEEAKAKGLHCQSAIPDKLPTLRIDPDRLGQALGNLLSNAIKYCRAGDTIAVQAGHAEGEVWIRVSDTGPGIAVEEQVLIFEPTYRGRALRRFPEGLGLGLSLARDLVLAHGGQLRVDSEPGAGSRFTIYLPVTSEPLA